MIFLGHLLFNVGSLFLVCESVSNIMILTTAGWIGMYEVFLETDWFVEVCVQQSIVNRASKFQNIELQSIYSPKNTRNYLYECGNIRGTN